jgi:hypothetical protein
MENIEGEPNTLSNGVTLPKELGADMKTVRWMLPILIGAAVVFTVVELRASGPVAVYAIVEKVVFEPSEARPERIQIWGAFAIQTQRSTATYSGVQRGFLYYKIEESVTGLENATVRAARARATLNAWADLKRVAATGEAVGFGGSLVGALDAGRVRKATDKPDSPDGFPIGNPVVKLGASQPGLVVDLKAALQAK